MVIRKIHTNYNNITKVIFFCIAILLIIGQLTQKADESETSMVNIIAPDWLGEGKMVAVSGYLVSANNFPVYTHTISTNTNRKFGLISTTINLNAYTHKNIQAYGKITGKTKNIPIIKVESIYIANQELVIQNKNTYFPQELVVIDTSNINDLIAKKTEDGIVLYLEDMPIITISPESCETNCKDLQDQVIQGAYDSFSSYPGITYYKVDSQTRIAFSDMNKPYRITSETDDLLLDVSESIRFIDEWYIQSKIGEIPASCKQIIDAATHKKISGSGTEVKISYTEKVADNASISCHLWFNINFNRLTPIIDIKTQD